jgi:hypothetical protein
MAYTALALACLALAVVGQTPVKQDLFVNGASDTDSYPCYRQPAIVEGSADFRVLLAFAEGRVLPGAACAPPIDTPRPINEIGGLVLRRSMDGGVTWAAATVVYSGNIDFYTVVRDNSTNTIWLMLQQTTSVLLFKSSNAGETWSRPVPLNASQPPAPLALTAPAVGHGIQLRSDLCPVRVNRELCVSPTGYMPATHPPWRLQGRRAPGHAHGLRQRQRARRRGAVSRLPQLPAAQRRPRRFMALRRLRPGRLARGPGGAGGCGC